MTSHTVTTTASQLRTLLAPVLPFADQGDSLPILSTLRVRGHGEWVTAFATDRYRAALQRVRIEAPADLDVNIPITSARLMLATFKTTRALDPELTLVFNKDTNRVSVESGSIGLGMFDARVSFALYDGEYPKALSILLTAAEAEPVAVADVGLNPHFMADFRHVAQRHEPMRVKAGEPGRPIFVAIGDDFRAAQMPVRSASDVPALIDDSWRALLTEPAKEQAPKSKPARKSRATSKALAS
jgi:DNA polymerase-3 subunit beta